MTSKVSILLIATVLLLIGCAAPVQEEALEAWHLTVVGKAGSKELSLEDIKALPSKEVQFESKETGTLNTYKGVALSDLLEAAGVDISTLQSADVEASDGFLATFDRELALAEDVVLVYEMDDGPLPSEMGKVRIIAPGQANKFQVKFVTRITVR